MVYDDLNNRDQAFVDELGAGNKTVVSAQLVSGLNGNGNAAIYLSQLLWWAKRKADEAGWFFRTRDDMQQRCGLGKQAQRTAEKTLTSLDIIETDQRGMPCKKHFRINYQQLISILGGDDPDAVPTHQAKAKGVGGAPSSGGYPQDPGAAGTYQHPIESNTENNTENSSSGSSAHAGARVDGVWDFLPEQHQDVSADVKEAYQEYKEGRVDLPMLARRYLTRNGSSAPTNTIAQHADEHPTPKVVAAYVVAGIKADRNPTSYASTILDQDWTRTDDGQTDGSFADQYAKHRAAARRGAGLDG